MRLALAKVRPVCRTHLSAPGLMRLARDSRMSRQLGLPTRHASQDLSLDTSAICAGAPHGIRRSAEHARAVDRGTSRSVARRSSAGAGSENFDHVLSGNSDHLSVALPRQKIVGSSAADEGKDDRHAQATRDSGASPRGPHVERNRGAQRRLGEDGTCFLASERTPRMRRTPVSPWWPWM